MEFSRVVKCCLIAFMIFTAGCTTENTPQPEDLLSFDASTKALKFNFTTSLKGENEVQDPAVETKATGHASVKISKDESYLEYKITVANIDNVTASHFHMAPAGSNGGVVAFLFSGPVMNPNGVLAEGIITESDLIGSLEGASLQELIDAIRAGNIYVNVHSSAFPAGELRGQL